MDKLTVLKVGGAVTQNKLILDKFLNNLTKIKGKKILVHGGGRELDLFLKINNHNECCKYMPEANEIYKLPKSWIVNVAATVIGDPFKNWIKMQIIERNKKVAEK